MRRRDFKLFHRCFLHDSNESVNHLQQANIENMDNVFKHIWSPWCQRICSKLSTMGRDRGYLKESQLETCLCFIRTIWIERIIDVLTEKGAHIICNVFKIYNFGVRRLEEYCKWYNHLNNLLYSLNMWNETSHQFIFSKHLLGTGWFKE